ncbi:MAG: AAA family ATPase [Nitrospirota bacterium]|nr:AAA family ATPase [Nitrospirota bacterium]
MSKQENLNDTNSYHSINKRINNKIKEVRSYKNKNAKITVHFSKQRESVKPPLYYKYDIQQYDLHPGYYFDEFTNLIPRGVAEYIDDGSRYVERIVRALYYFNQCALIGPTGTGKTHIVYLIAELMGLPVWEINCALQTTGYDLIGRYIGLGKENWIDGQVVLWLKHGGILYLDEANLMRQDIVSRLNSVLDSRRHLVLTEKDNETILRHKYAYCIISINPISPESVGTKKLNTSFRRRMSVWIKFSYQSIGTKISDQEAELIIRRSKIDKDTAYKILKVGAEMRRQYEMGDLPYGPSPRDLVNWAILCKDGTDPVTAAEESVIALTSEDFNVQEEVRNIVEKFFT